MEIGISWADQGLSNKSVGAGGTQKSGRSRQNLTVQLVVSNFKIRPVPFVIYTITLFQPFCGSVENNDLLWNLIQRFYLVVDILYLRSIHVLTDLLLSLEYLLKYRPPQVILRLSRPPQVPGQVRRGQ